MAEGKRVVDTIKLKEDIGYAGPLYKRATLQLWSDGTVTWTQVEEQSAATYKYEVSSKPEAADADN